jgi:hypothetical protein
MALSDYIARINEIARKAKSESKLEGEFSQILKECRHEFGIPFDPHINETLKSMGLSQVDADQPDGVFGHIVYDYKAPGMLSSADNGIATKDASHILFAMHCYSSLVPFFLKRPNGRP